MKANEAAIADHLLTTFLPEGHTRESWLSAQAMADKIGAIVGTLPPSPPRCIQDRRDGRTYVYFIGGDDTPIKIGFSAAPFERLSILQTAHWVRLRILGKIVGTLDDEREYHARFAGHRLEGEWFARHPDILTEIDRLSSPPTALADLSGWRAIEARGVVA